MSLPTDIVTGSPGTSCPAEFVVCAVKGVVSFWVSMICRAAGKIIADKSAMLTPCWAARLELPCSPPQR